MYRRIKRVTDIIIALMALILLLPLFLLVGVLIKLDSKGPVFFKQKRWGKDKSEFVCLKFRTMRLTAPDNIATRELKDAMTYITSSGRLLRRLGLDELPQLINVLRGEMSLIGPRPVVLAEKNLIDEREKYGANAMVPGIGGWAQSNGRDEIDFRTKARLDGEYAQNFGWRMDASCMWRTAVAIFTSKGFKEGHFGDNRYRQKVRKHTKKISLSRRIYSRIRTKAVKRLTVRSRRSSVDV